jgi:hypothetical protein
VATFTDPYSNGGTPDATSTFPVTINWGDGSSSAGTVTLSSSTSLTGYKYTATYTVTGAHTYAEDTASGHTYPITITVNGDDSGTAATGTTSATVSDAGASFTDLSGGGDNFNATAGSAFSGQIAHFSDPIDFGGAAGSGDDVASNYTVSINWGDGTAVDTSSGSVTLTNSGATYPSSATYTVSGTHTYASPGQTHTVTVTVSSTEADDQNLQLTATATVSGAITVSSVNINQGTDPIISASNPSSGVLSFTTDGPNNFAVGDDIVIAGINSTYNGSWTVHSVGTNSFTVSDGTVSGQATVTRAGTVTDVNAGDTGELINGSSGGGHSASFNSQRSMVDSIVYTFNQAVSLDQAGTASGDAFSITGTGPNAGTSTPTWNYSSPDGGFTWVVTFSGTNVTGNSIANGEWQIVLDSSKVTASVGTGTMAASETDKFYRLFGDSVGNSHHRVNATDNTPWQNTVGSTSTQSAFLAYFDVNDDGRINATDNTVWQNDLGTVFSVTGFTPTI